MFVATTGGANALTAIDVTNSDEPRTVATTPLPGVPQLLSAWPLGPADAIVVAIVPGGYGLVVLESHPGILRRAATLRLPTECSAATGAHVRDGYAYVACTGLGIAQFSVADHAHPAYVGALPGYDGSRLAGHGLGLVAVTRGSVATVALADPGAPESGSIVPLLGNVTGPLVNTADPNFVLAGRGNDVALLDVADPAHPALASIVDLPMDETRQWVSLVVHDRVAVAVATNSGGAGSLLTLDLAEPRRPRQLGWSSTREVPTGLATDGRTAYVTETSDVGPDTMEVFDLTNASAPRSIAELPLAGQAHLVAGAMVVTRADGVFVFDITAPDAPALMAHVALGVSASFAEGNFVYVNTRPDRDRGLGPAVVVLELSDPRHPKVVGTLAASFPGFPRPVAKLGSLLIFASSSEVHVVDVADPTAPVAWRRPTWGAGGLTWVGAVTGFVYAAGNPTGLWSLRVGGALPTVVPPSATPTSRPPPTRTPTALPIGHHAIHLPWMHSSPRPNDVAARLAVRAP